VSETEAVRGLRRGLGRRLATARKKAGYTQREFAQRISYSRSTLSTVESGIQRAGRPFWQACDRVLGTGTEYEHGYDQVRAQQHADHARREAAAPSVGSEGSALRAATVSQATAAYQTQGWVIKTNGNQASLVTGTVLDALEVPHAAGMLAASWWQGTSGTPDPIRGLPALPDPRRALAVISCAERCYFLAAAGLFPWAERSLPQDPGTRDKPIIRWHSGGSPIPAPPGIDPEGQPATWIFLPAGPPQLAAPVMLLDLLAKALAATAHRPRTLALASNVLVVPARL
jgi:DNA-binding XRE family transcriptional regulator